MNQTEPDRAREALKNAILYQKADKIFSLIRELRPDRWKLLRMIAIEWSNDSGRDLL